MGIFYLSFLCPHEKRNHGAANQRGEEQRQMMDFFRNMASG